MAMVEDIQSRVNILTELNGGMPSLDGRRVETPGYQLTEIRSRHREIVRLAVAGMKGTEIAEHLNIHKQTVSNVLNNPIILRQIKMLQDAKDASAGEATTLDKLRPYAVSALGDLVLDVDEKAKAVRLNAAKEILDRTDGKAVQHHEIKQTSVILEQIQILKERARKEGVLPQDADQSEEMEDAQFEEIESTPEAVTKEGSGS